LHALRARLVEQRASDQPFGVQQWALRDAIGHVEAGTPRSSRVWLRTVNLTVRVGGVHCVAVASKRARGVVLERSTGAVVELRSVPPEHRLVVVFEGAPVEGWSPLIRGAFSPSLLALRMLTRFYRLRMDWWDPNFDDKELFIRKIVYPLAPKWRAAMLNLERLR
jgi:hypothetical protein